ncbi:MAG TPA: proline dehydrogenase family protein [Gemmatimonadales bacterium]|nr:proline dehydrogenase family protein [Gemmatimonadales bacterium]
MRGLLFRLILTVTGWGWVRRLFTMRAGRRLAMRFVAGESLDEAVAVARRLNGRGFSVSLDHLGEHVTGHEEAERARDDYLACIARIGSEGLDANVSIKLTQLGLGLDDELALVSLESLAAAAAAIGSTVTIDMEESAYTERTIALYETAQRRFGNLGLALQAYLLRTPADLDRILPLGGHVRLCKGAYDEPAEVAHQRGSEVDASFDRLATLLMAAETTHPAIATHDERRIDHVRAHTRGGPFEFQMLYGVRGRLQSELREAGHAVRLYVPYGDRWYPYLTRRIAERPANLWFFLRALVGR